MLEQLLTILYVDNLLKSVIKRCNFGCLAATMSKLHKVLTLLSCAMIALQCQCSLWSSVVDDAMQQAGELACN